MPFSHPNTFELKNMEQYLELCNLIEEQLEMVCSEKTRASTKFIINEALDNALEHGEFPIKIDFSNRSDKKELLIRVVDSGNGFLGVQKMELIQKKGTDFLLNEALLNTRGRGILMMATMAKAISYNNKGNELLLVIAN